MMPEDFIDHPEGGRFLQVFKSRATVVAPDGRSRSALTHIYFALGEGEVSRFHKVRSDEVWNLYRGSGLYLYTWDGSDAPPQRHELSDASGAYCHVVPAGMWQAAEPIGDSVMVGCSVGPGFEYEDFELMEPGSELAEQVESFDPAMSRFTTV
ncbi:hypothetical protein LF63_0102595 [Oleiagrimonas soli]|nr:hypothetical protein LF63_0102595 [Oleiagrimonas soli]